MKDVKEEAFRMWCAMHSFDLPGFDAWLQTIEGSPAHQELTERRELAWKALRSGNKEGNFRHLEWMRLRWDKIRSVQLLAPLKPFAENYGRGEGPVKTLVREVLGPLERRLGRKAEALEIWGACKSRRPKGLRFEASVPWGKPLRITASNGTTTKFARFRVIVSEVRKKADT